MSNINRTLVHQEENINLSNKPGPCVDLLKTNGSIVVFDNVSLVTFLNPDKGTTLDEMRASTEIIFDLFGVYNVPYIKLHVHLCRWSHPILVSDRAFFQNQLLEQKAGT